MAFLLLPTELIDAIVAEIHSAADLVALALTCKLLLHRIVPSPLNFRELSCDLCRPDLWTALSERPWNTRNVYSLNLFDEGPGQQATVRVPRSLPGFSMALPATVCARGGNGSCEQDCIVKLGQAIAHMPLLHRFSFQTYTAKKHDPTVIFRAILRSCPQLRNLEISVFDWNPPFESVSPPLWDLSNLTKVSITAKRSIGLVFPLGVPKYILPMFEMLGRCPHLADLRVGIETRGELVEVSVLLNSQTWPHLKRLVLEGDWEMNLEEPTKMFFERHPQLEILQLPRDFSLTSRTFPTTLPLLRWLFCGVLQHHADFPHISAARFPSLQYISMDEYHPQVYPFQSICALLHRIPTLLGVTLAVTAVAQLDLLRSAAPYLQRLVLIDAPWNNRRRHNSRIALPDAASLAILATFKCLTHFESAAAIPVIHLSSELESERDHRTEANDLAALLCALAAASQLRFVGVDHPNVAFGGGHEIPTKWYEIHRSDHDDQDVSWTEVRDLRKVKWHDWEDTCRYVGSD
ncbi:hypothetical protein C8F01DRAFT_1373349 [Mycena amicta]|nr:hypothetical protein C8F01DRAFT_1373349 [Mycena amicta]